MFKGLPYQVSLRYARPDMKEMKDWFDDRKLKYREDYHACYCSSIMFLKSDLIEVDTTDNKMMVIAFKDYETFAQFKLTWGGNV